MRNQENVSESLHSPSEDRQLLWRGDKAPAARGDQRGAPQIPRATSRATAGRPRHPTKLRSDDKSRKKTLLLNTNVTGQYNIEINLYKSLYS